MHPLRERELTRPPGERSHVAAGVPMTPAQETVWLLDERYPADRGFNVQLAARVLGPLSLPALAAAASGLRRRHDMLRTRFATGADGVVRMHETPHTDAPPLLVDLEGLAPRGRAAMLGRLATEAVARPFEREGGLLHRVVVGRLGPKDHALALALHHVIADGWSLGVLGRDLSALYAAALRGTPGPPPPPLGFRDRAGREHAARGGERLEREAAWWRDRLRGLASLDLPTDRPPPPVRSRSGHGADRTLDPETTAALREVARSARATVNAPLLACFAVLLARWSGRRDFGVATLAAGRPHRDLDRVVGCFFNTLVLRPDLSGRPTFGELTSRARAELLAAYDHADLPYGRFVRELGREPARARFSVQTTPGSPVQLDGLALAPLAPDRETLRYDVKLDVHDAGPVLILHLALADDLFDRQTAERLAGELEHLARDCAERPDDHVKLP